MEKKPFDIVINEEFVNKKKIFVVHCLDLGIASQGHTYEEALKNIKDAILLYLEECSEEIPKQQKELMPPMATRLFL
ncbi:MAG: type II toxin-antitoxin system HicB family antitoxin [Nanoarchaeota archaeon]|nr:type II toxin-antitoxin system HicB family antitoxin [Nanoarchaeota archaeon]